MKRLFVWAIVLTACNADQTFRTSTLELGSGDYVVIYDDGALAPGFQSTGYDAINFASTAQVHVGSSAMAMDVSQTWKYYAFSATSAIDLDEFCTLEAYVHGGSTGGQDVDFRPNIFWSPPSGGLGYCGDAGPLAGFVDGGVVPANRWAKLSVNLHDDACWGAGANGGGFMILTDDNSGQGTLYFDDVRLVCCTPGCAGTCTPDCAGKQCGDDGCGGSCGTCSGGTTCNTQQRCEATCTPDCAGKQCGGDGCGGSCGTCSGGSCSAAGQCEGGSGSGDYFVIYNDGALAPGFAQLGYDDIDLASSSPVHGGSSAMAMDVSQAWTYYAISATSAIDLSQYCGLEAYVHGGSTGGQSLDFRPSTYWSPPTGDLGYCDDAGMLASHVEGGAVPANRWAKLSVDLPSACWGSGANGGGFMLLTNEQSGQGTVYFDDLKLVCCTPGCAGTCTPDCAGKQCGGDGCGGSCGTCSGGQQTCSAAGQCEATCTPDCAGKQCGPDGCGGSCGTCGAPQYCDGAGQCVNDETPGGSGAGDNGRRYACTGSGSSGTRVLCVDDDNQQSGADGTARRPFRTINQALAVASGGDVIQVAAGLYNENIVISGSESSAAATTRVLLGGFRGASAADYAAGRAGDFNTRDGSSYVSTIRNPDGQGSPVIELQVAGATVIDGFRITNGVGIADPYGRRGSGVYAFGGSPTISHNLIEGNGPASAPGDALGGGIFYEAHWDDSFQRQQAPLIASNIIRNNISGRGAGIAVIGGGSKSDPAGGVRIMGNLIEDNAAKSDHGGGVYATGQPMHLTFHHNIVRRNSIGLDLSRATWGGGLVVAGKGAYLDMVDCEISENQSRGAGGGLFIDDEADALVKNTLVRANGCSVDDQGLGAGIYVDGLDRGTGSSATFENIVVVDHDCHPYSTVGVALYAEKDSTVIIRNSIFRNNVNSEGSSQFVVQTGSVVTVSYSNVQGGLTGSGNIQSGGGNIDADPMFVNPAAGDYHLKPGSRCIDSGWPSSPYDQEPAPNGGRINMGMYGNTAEATQS